MIVGVATDVIAFLDDETRFTKLTCKSLGKDRTGKTRTNNKEIESHQGDSSARTMKHVR